MSLSVRRLGVGGVVVAAVLLAAGVNPALAGATSGPAAPTGITLARDATDPHRVTVAWKPVSGVHHYNVSVFNGSTDTVTVVYPPTTSLTFTESSNCARPRATVGSRDAGGAGGTSGYVWLNPLGPGGVVGMTAARGEVRSTASASWRAPAYPGLGGVGSYRVRLVRVTDGVTVSDTSTTDTAASFTGLDPDRLYVVKVSAGNAYGSCTTQQALVGNQVPFAPQNLVIARDPGVAAQVNLSWQPPAWAGYSPVTGYLLGYGSGRITTWRSVADPTATLALDPARSWVFSVRAVNASGASPLSPARILAPATASGKSAIAPGVTIEQSGDMITVRLAGSIGSVAAYPRLVVRVSPTVANGGFSDTQWGQNGAQVMTFGPIPNGVYTVQVDGSGSTGEVEWVRKVINVGDLGEVPASQWRLLYGHAAIRTGQITMPAGENRVISTVPRNGGDMVLSTDARLSSGAGYGVWARASFTTGAAVTGYSFQFDPGYASVNPTYGPALLLRQWSNGAECGTPLAKVKMPASIAANSVHRVVVVALGDSLSASIDNITVFNVPSLSAAVAASPCHYAAPTGSQIGFRTWNTGSAQFTNTTLN
jgi:hypothetical protein